MKISKLSKRLFHRIVVEISAELAAYADCGAYAPSTDCIIEGVLTHYDVQPCLQNKDHTNRLYRACGLPHYVHRQGVVSLTAHQMQPARSEVGLKTPDGIDHQQPLALLPLANKIGLDLAQLNWGGHYRPLFKDTAIAWSQDRFLQGVKYQLNEGIRCADGERFLRTILNSSVKLLAHTGGSNNRLVLESLAVGDIKVSCEVRIETRTHRHREWRCGRAVGHLLLQMMQEMSKRCLDEQERAEARSRGVRIVPDVSIAPLDPSLAKTRGVYLEY